MERLLASHYQAVWGHSIKKKKEQLVMGGLEQSGLM